MDRPFAAYTGAEPYIFVSYSHRDSSTVYPELTWLRESGFNIWYDEGIEAGTEWREELARAVKNAKLVLYFVTPESVQSENCRKEVSFAIDEGTPIIAIHLKETNLPDGLKLTLSDRQAILKYEIPKGEYQQKLQARIAYYLDQEIVPPVVEARNKTMPILAGAAVVLVLTIGLIVYNQQTEQQTTGITTEPVTTVATSNQSESNTGEKVDLAAMQSIAVLPFTNMSTSEEIAFLADGLSEDILDNLAQLKYLKVASRSASFQFTGRGVDPSSVGKSLGVAYLLEGSVRQQGEKLRITAQLIRTKDGSHVWSKSYERSAADDFEMQTAVAVNIAHIAQSELGQDVFANYGWKQIPVFTGKDPVAVRHFINALNEDRKISLGEGGNWDTQIQLLKSAIGVDSNFLYAHNMLARASVVGHWAGRLPLQTARPAAYEAIEGAMKLDPDNIFYQFQLANIHLGLDLDYAQAQAMFEQYLERDPQDPYTHQLLAEIDLREGRTSDALRRLVIATDSDLTRVGVDLAGFLTITSISQCMAGDCERALEGTAEALRLATGGQLRADALGAHILSLLILGGIEKARPLIDEARRLDGSINPERYFFYFAQIGETEKARDILTDSRYDLRHHFFLALGHLALGDIDKTFASIEVGIEDRNRFLIDSLIVAEWWDPIRDDPRFDEMLALLDSKVTHTQQYLRDHKITQLDRQ